jgi:hypothetical protein
MPSPLLAVLLAAAMQQPSPQSSDSVIAYARTTLTPLTDSATLHKAGYFAIGFGGGAKDLSPFQGQHWVHVRQFLTNAPMELTKPTITMFLPVRDTLIPIGVAHLKRVVANTPSPTDIGGVAAEWHVHVMCRGIPGEGQLLADGVQDCLERGGTPAPNQITMVHAWTVENPDGPYGHDNPALPFIATGLKAPHHFMRDERLFAVAIGESYGARLITAAIIERYTATAGTPNKLAAHRATMRDLVRDLLAAEKKGDTKAYDATKKKVLATWATLVDEYHAIAPTPQLRKRFDLELEQLLGAEHHHSG